MCRDAPAPACAASVMSGIVMADVASNTHSPFQALMTRSSGISQQDEGV
jgi:hypothetical protein